MDLSMSRGVGVFLQARLGSTRFPNKVIAPFGGSTVVEYAMARLSGVRGVLALLTDTVSYGTLSPLARRLGWKCYAGEPDDVMKRFIDAANVYGVDEIVRACGDSPLVSSEQAEVLLQIHGWSAGDITVAL